jgi:hypothetical protein
MEIFNKYFVSVAQNIYMDNHNDKIILDWENPILTYLVHLYNCFLQ